MIWFQVAQRVGGGQSPDPPCGWFNLDHDKVYGSVNTGGFDQTESVVARFFFCLKVRRRSLANLLHSNGVPAGPPKISCKIHRHFKSRSDTSTPGTGVIVLREKRVWGSGVVHMLNHPILSWYEIFISCCVFMLMQMFYSHPPAQTYSVTPTFRNSGVALTPRGAAMSTCLMRLATNFFPPVSSNPRPSHVFSK